MILSPAEESGGWNFAYKIKKSGVQYLYWNDLKSLSYSVEKGDAGYCMNLGTKQAHSYGCWDKRNNL